MTALTVSMPYWRSPKQVRRAVDSILNQTFTDLQLIVVNDGDGPGAWEPLADITDPRLIRFTLPQNRGRYYADAVTLAACNTEWWSPHDSDDYSVPDRFEKLMALLGTGEAAFSAALYHTLDKREVKSPVKPRRFSRTSLHTVARYPAGLFRTEVARAVGGPHPELRGSYDTAFVGLIWSVCRPAVTQEALYHVYKRRGSLTTDEKTKLSGDWRKRQQRRRRGLYLAAQAAPVGRWPEVLAPSPDIARSVAEDVERLGKLLV